MLLGGAQSVWRDVVYLEALVGGPWPGLVIACNEIGVYWPRELHHWVTLHPHRFHRVVDGQGDWLSRRWEAFHPPARYTWAHSQEPDAPVSRTFTPWEHGSSGLEMVNVAKEELGANRLVLCGVPMDMQPHFNSREPWHRAVDFWPAWPERSADLRSMSGQTRKQFGAPTLEWLEAPP